VLFRFSATFLDLDSVKSGHIRLLNQNNIRTLFFANDALTLLNSRIELICEVIAIFDCKKNYSSQRKGWAGAVIAEIKNDEPKIKISPPPNMPRMAGIIPPRYPTSCFDCTIRWATLLK
jgi:hypothetical protein